MVNSIEILPTVDPDARVRVDRIFDEISLDHAVDLCLRNPLKHESLMSSTAMCLLVAPLTVSAPYEEEQKLVLLMYLEKENGLSRHQSLKSSQIDFMKQSWIDFLCFLLQSGQFLCPLELITRFTSGCCNKLIMDLRIPIFIKILSIDDDLLIFSESFYLNIQHLPIHSQSHHFLFMKPETRCIWLWIATFGDSSENKM